MQVVKDWQRQRRKISKKNPSSSNLSSSKKISLMVLFRPSILISPNPMFIHADASWADHESPDAISE